MCHTAAIIELESSGLETASSSARLRCWLSLRIFLLQILLLKNIIILQNDMNYLNST